MEATLDAVKREDFGKNNARRIRVTGRIPAVLYGGGSGETATAQTISVDPKAVQKILHSDKGANSIISLTLDGATTRVMLREYQLDPISHHVLHADFFRVAMDKLMTVTVPIAVRGEARGVKQQGGLLDFVHHEVDIECLPADIPDHIEVDVTDLGLNQAIRLKDVADNVKWKAVTDPEVMLVHVASPKAVVEATPAEGAAPAAPAEPEVIKKGKAEKEEEGE